MINQKNAETQASQEIIDSLPAQPFLRNEMARHFVIGRGQLRNTSEGTPDYENSIMYYIRTGGGRHTFPFRPVYHAHDYYELIYVVDGVLTQHLEKSIFRLTAGDAILLNNQIRHCEGLETDCVCLYLQLSPEFLRQLLYTNPLGGEISQHESSIFPEFCPAEAAGTSDSAGMALDFRRTLKSRTIEDAAGQLLEQIIDTITRKDWGYAFTVQGLLLRLLHTLESPEAYHASLIRTNAGSDEILYTSILHYIREQHGRMSREKLADLLHYHPDYLNRVVKRNSGMSFKQLSQKYFLEHVQTQLKETDISINDLLLELEYTNKSHFYQIFRDATGMTPQEYRERFRKQT